ncbi:hypothetical protein AAG570_002472 [Ranatra chinensis]|uniref:Uncharacterized protein n=1 Tax=Ranatra chinensis TaxID=642074 RepID=A0ABD0Y7N0_9HEMI
MEREAKTVRWSAEEVADWRRTQVCRQDPRMCDFTLPDSSLSLTEERPGGHYPTAAGEFEFLGNDIKDDLAASITDLIIGNYGLAEESSAVLLERAAPPGWRLRTLTVSLVVLSAVFAWAAYWGPPLRPSLCKLLGCPQRRYSLQYFFDWIFGDLLSLIGR